MYIQVEDLDLQDSLLEGERLKKLEEEETLDAIDSVLLARQRLKMAIIQVLEEGDPETQKGWGCFHPFSAVQEEARERFADAVIQRVGK